MARDYRQAAGQVGGMGGGTPDSRWPAAAMPASSAQRSRLCDEDLDRDDPWQFKNFRVG